MTETLRNLGLLGTLEVSQRSWIIVNPMCGLAYTCTCVLSFENKISLFFMWPRLASASRVLGFQYSPGHLPKESPMNIQWSPQSGSSIDPKKYRM